MWREIVDYILAPPRRRFPRWAPTNWYVCPVCEYGVSVSIICSHFGQMSQSGILRQIAFLAFLNSLASRNNMPFAQLIGARFTPYTKGHASCLYISDSWYQRHGFQQQDHRTTLLESEWASCPQLQSAPSPAILV